MVTCTSGSEGGPEKPTSRMWRRALRSGHRESKASWTGVLRDLRDRGLSAAKLLVVDGHLGIWATLAQVWPETAEQRCWNHRLLNVLDKLPKRGQAEARQLLTQIPYAPTRQDATKRRDQFAKRFRRICPDAVDILERDGDRMVAFYDFPEAHRQHLRTTNVVESPFASLRLRTDAAKRYNYKEEDRRLISFTHHLTQAPLTLPFCLEHHFPK